MNTLPCVICIILRHREPFQSELEFLRIRAGLAHTQTSGSSFSETGAPCQVTTVVLYVLVSHGYIYHWSPVSGEHLPGGCRSKGFGMLPGFPPRRPPHNADVLLTELNAVVIDFETTGLYPNQGDEIIELAGVHVDGFEIQMQSSYECLVNPGRPVSESAFRVHKIPDALLAEQQPLTSVLLDFLAFLQDRVVIGQNVAFDLSFLVRAMERNGLPPLQHLVLDTKWLSRVAFPKLTHHGLDVIAERLGIERPTDRHRARVDVQFTAEVLVRLLKKLTKRGYSRIGDLIEAYEATEGGRFGDGEILETLERCYRERHVAEIAYAAQDQITAPAEQSRNIRKVAIYHLSPPYLIGFCHTRNAIRTFRIDRVARVQPLDVDYGIPEGFHPQDHFLRWSK